MAQCEKCETTENIVFSGVDALLLGVEGAQTEKICYPCANADRAAKFVEIKDVETADVSEQPVIEIPEAEG